MSQGMIFFWVALGGAIGSVGRFSTAEFIDKLTGWHNTTGTFCVNVVGSFIIGTFAAATLLHTPDPTVLSVRIFVVDGICGGFTTFSTFSSQTLSLFQENRLIAAGCNIIFSVAVCLCAVWIGYRFGGTLIPMLWPHAGLSALPTLHQEAVPAHTGGVIRNISQSLLLHKTSVLSSVHKAGTAIHQGTGMRGTGK